MKQTGMRFLQLFTRVSRIGHSLMAARTKAKALSDKKETGEEGFGMGETEIRFPQIFRRVSRIGHSFLGAKTKPNALSDKNQARGEGTFLPAEACCQRSLVAFLPRSLVASAGLLPA